MPAFAAQSVFEVVVDGRAPKQHHVEVVLACCSKGPPPWRLPPDGTEPSSSAILPSADADCRPYLSLNRTVDANSGVHLFFTASTAGRCAFGS